MSETGEKDHLSRVSSLSRDAGITAAVAALFFLLRILAVSKWDWRTAAEVAETVDFGDAATIMLGTVFAEPVFTGALVIAIAPILIMAIVWPPGARARVPVIAILFLAGLLALTISLTVSLGEWWILVGLVVATLAHFSARRLWREGKVHALTVRLVRSLGALGAVGALAMAAGISTPWVALEDITTDTTTLSGYVLETPSGFLKVLTDEPREVITLISSTVAERQVVRP